jgi:hypothetical protein
MVSCPACRKTFRLEAKAEPGVILAELDEDSPTKPAAAKRRAALATVETAERDGDDSGAVLRAKKKGKKHKKKASAGDDYMALRNRLVGGVAMLVGMGLVIAGIGEYLPQGATDALGVDICKYLAMGFGGLLTAVGIVSVIRG